jgi:hypothetical protein
LLFAGGGALTLTKADYQPPVQIVQEVRIEPDSSPTPFRGAEDARDRQRTVVEVLR